MPAPSGAEGSPHDTPVDSPAVGALIEAADLGPDAALLGAQALQRARSVETLEVAYAAWAELQEAHRTARRRWAEERQRLTEQGALLLGAVKAAGGTPNTTEAGLAKTTALDGFLVDAKQKLEGAQAQLAERASSAEKAFQAELGKLREELKARIARQSAAIHPVFKLMIRVLAGERRILHAHRLGADESVIALWVLTGRIPSRYDYLFDDSTDDALMAPPMLYADEGVTELRPSALTLGRTLTPLKDVWPVKGMIPLTLPDGTWLRWISRGAVLEAEVQDGEGFRNLLTHEEAERVTGLLLSHKLAGKLELELVRE
ncbi:MAG: hypothetical protein Q8L48_16310 [Archangium sp.]|nr:hypothetical protein [Archangium sp.]